MQKKVSFIYKRKRFHFAAEECFGVNRFFGLMFKNFRTAEALLFDFKKPANIAIHSFFVFFPFVAVWFDKKNKVIEVRKINPFTFSAKANEPFAKLLEIPVNKKYSKTIKFLLSRR